VKAHASLEANRSAATSDEQVGRLLAEAAAARQQAKIDARAAEEQASGKPRPGRKPKPAAGRVDPERVANPTDPDSRIMKTRWGWVQGYNAQLVVTPQQIILTSEVTTEANDVRQLQPMIDQAQAMVERLLGEDARLAAAAADAGSCSEENAASQTEECELFIATCQDRKQRAEWRAAASPRGRMPKGLSARQRLQRKLRTKRGRIISAQRGASVEPVLGQMKHRQGAGQFSLRGLGACRGEWHLQAAVSNLRKLHRASVRRRAAGGRMDEKQERRA
jgi:hypothetical protein